MKPYRAHRTAVALAILLLVGWAAGARAQLPATVKFVNKFRVPEFDEKGTKKSELLGDRAEMLDDGKVKITGLKILVYRDGELEGTLDSEECIFDRKERNAASNAAVTIRRGDMLVTGKGFRWSSGNQRIEILNDVRVTLQGIPVWAKKEKR
jgi:lipopolysaccharide export system protein LptC